MPIPLAHYVSGMFFDLQGRLRPTFSVEVGAYDGHFSKEIKATHPHMHAYAFEASKPSYDKFQYFQNNFWNVNYLHMAMADHTGTMEFNMHGALPDDAPLNSLLPRVGAPNVKQTVPCTTMDAFFIESGLMGPDDTACLWLDVEGATGLVLPSSKKFLAQTTSILVEVEHHRFWEGQWMAEDVDQFLTAEGFHLVARDYEMHPQQENYLYIK